MTEIGPNLKSLLETLANDLTTAFVSLVVILCVAVVFRFPIKLIKGGSNGTES